SGPVNLPGFRLLSLVLQPDGKIIVSGSILDADSRANFALARFNSNGTRDTTFGTGGPVTTSFIDPVFGHVSAEAWTVGVQADGKIVAAGDANIEGGEGFALARYNSNGTLDTTFGTGGKVTTDFPGGTGGPSTWTSLTSIAFQVDGKIIAVGS